MGEEKEPAPFLHIVVSPPPSPYDFSLRRKWLITILSALLTLNVTFGSSVFSSTISATVHEFETTETVMLLGVSLYVLGFSLGPILWGPLSEVVGRRPPLLGGYIIFALLQIPTALSHSLPGLLICRLLAGSFGAAPVVLVSASYSDFWDPAHRGTAAAVYSVASFAGPTLGPIVGTFVTENIGWRWTAWITLIMAGLFGPAAFILVPETYGPVLKKEAQSTNFVRRYLIKPVLMLGSELILVILTIYISIVYGIMYMTFYAIPYIFRHERDWKSSIAALPFLSMLVGILFTCVFMAWYSSHYYQNRLIARRGKVLPEDRLPPIMLGSFLMPAGLFWLAWTSSIESWVPQVISLTFVGAGIMLIFTSGVAFIIDIYLTSSASALAANTIIRSAAAAGLPLAAPRMYRELGTAWATSMLGFMCVALIPAPFLFHVYGERLRRRSKFAPSL